MKKFRKLKNLIKLTFIFSIFLFPSTAYSELEIKPKIDYFNKKKINEYILGKGDQITIKVKNLKTIIQSSHTIDESGFINTERLGEIYIEGLTRLELQELLKDRYIEFIKDPNVYIDILRYRPQKIYIDGEVYQPGIYSLLINEINYTEGLTTNSLNKKIEQKSFNQDDQSIISIENLENQIDTEKSDFYTFPTLTDAIRKAGGITLNANLKDIKIIRKNSLSNGGGKIKANINMLEGLGYGIPINNLTLRDGDYIVVGKTDKPSLKQVSEALKGSLNPKYINIFVGGKVENPGSKVVPRLSSLLEGIYLAGGKQTFVGPIKLVRYNSNGILETKKIKFNSKSKPGTSKNPYLQNGDIVYVGKSSLNIATEVITEIISPFNRQLEGYLIYKALD